MKTKTYTMTAERRGSSERAFGNDLGNIPQISLVTRQQRRALEFLAGSRDGETEAMMQAHGFTIPLMVSSSRPLA